MSEIQTIDPRNLTVDGQSVWRDGRCKICGYPTYEAGIAPDCAAGDKDCFDYYLWCSNKECEKHAGECLGDMECPPPWADHDRN